MQFWPPAKYGLFQSWPHSGWTSSISGLYQIGPFSDLELFHMWPLSDLASVRIIKCGDQEERGQVGPGRKVARIVAAASSSPQTELTSAFLLSVTHCLAIYVLLCTRDTHCLAIKWNDSHMRSVPESTTFSYPVFRIRFFLSGNGSKFFS